MTTKNERTKLKHNYEWRIADALEGIQGELAGIREALTSSAAWKVTSPTAEYDPENPWIRSNLRKGVTIDSKTGQPIPPPM